MRVGIIAEGRTDVVILKRIIASHLDIDTSDVISFRPNESKDETDLFGRNIDQFSNWIIVKEECQRRETIEDFFSSDEDNKIFVIHIDSDRCEDLGYDVKRPDKHRNNEYSSQLREAIGSKLDEWLRFNGLENNVCYAIAIEEIEAWLLAFYKTDKLTHLYNNPKDTLRQLEIYKDLKGKSEIDKYFDLSKAGKKTKEPNKSSIFKRKLI